MMNGISLHTSTWTATDNKSHCELTVIDRAGFLLITKWLSRRKMLW